MKQFAKAIEQQQIGDGKYVTALNQTVRIRTARKPGNDALLRNGRMITIKKLGGPSPYAAMLFLPRRASQPMH